MSLHFTVNIDVNKKVQITLYQAFFYYNYELGSVSLLMNETYC